MADDDDDKKPPAKKARVEEDPPPEPTIWNTVSNLNGHPLLRVAIELAHENFGYCLSSCYGMVDQEGTSDHLGVIMGLKGSFQVDEKNLYPKSYATSVLSPEGEQGVFFNKQLVERSTDEARRRGSVDKMLRSLVVVGIIATLQQTVEHELGHLKYHQEGIDDAKFKKRTPTKKDSKDTPTEVSLEGEAGYAVQSGMRHKYFGGRNEPMGITINDDRTGGDQFADSYEFRLGRIEANAKGKLNLKVGDNAKEMEMEDIIKHMNYPNYPRGQGPKCGSGSGGPSDEKPDAGDGGSGGGSDGCGGGGGGRSGPSRGGGQTGRHRPSKWIESVKEKLNQAMPDAKLAWNPPEFNLCSNPNDKFNRWDQAAIPFHLYNNDVDGSGTELLQAAIDHCLQCKIQIITCDENWKEKRVFATDEKIFTKVKITNVTESPALLHVLIAEDFGREGLQLEFKDIIPGYSRGGTCQQWCIPIAPEETYTLWRHFTSGNVNSMTCAYETPQPGTYTIRAEYYGKYFDQTTQVTIVDAASYHGS